MSWFNDNPNRVIDARLAYESAGAMGRGVAGVGKAMLDYGQIQYKKKRDKKNDENLANTNATKVKVHEIDYAKSTDTAKINNTGKVKVAKVKANADKYVIDAKTGIAKIDYAKSTDTAKINNTGKVKVAKIGYAKSVDTAKITGKAKIKSAELGYKGKKYSADISAENNKRTTSTLSSTTKEKTKAQRYVADKQFEGAKLKTSTKKKSIPKWKKDLLKKARTPKQRELILKMNNDIGEEDI